MPIEPGFAMTVYKAKGRTLYQVIVDLAGAEPLYVMRSRATSLEGLYVLRGSDAKQITKRQSEDLREEFGRLDGLRWETVTKYGTEAERNMVPLQGVRSEVKSDGMTWMANSQNGERHSEVVGGAACRPYSLFFVNAQLGRSPSKTMSRCQSSGPNIGRLTCIPPTRTTFLERINSSFATK